MIRIIKKADRHFADRGWLKTFWLFSFSDYYAPDNINHGALRVFNDDIVQPGTGFGMHPHEEMEIVTLVLKGEMTHQDSMGNKTVIRQGDVQRMTAGTGLRHSEWNHGNRPVHFFQIWILPDHAGLDPSYDQKFFTPDKYDGQLHILACEEGNEETVSLHTDATISRARLAENDEIEIVTRADRSQFLYLIEGEITCNDIVVCERDQARITREEHLHIVARQGSDLVLVDVRNTS